MGLAYDPVVLLTYHETEIVRREQEIARLTRDLDRVTAQRDKFRKALKEIANELSDSVTADKMVDIAEKALSR